MKPQRNRFVGRGGVEAITPLEGRRNWLLFLTLARDHGRRALEGERVDGFEAAEFARFVRRLATPFPVQTPASCHLIATASRDLACAVLAAGAEDDRAAAARLLIPVLDHLDAALAADTRQRSELSRRISGEGEG